jgi:probable rRNA maturation factor
VTGQQSCEVELVDFTDSIDSELAAELTELCCFALQRERVDSKWTVSIVLTGDNHLIRLHDEFMGIPEPTDILTFPDEDQPGGDIVISVEQAERQRHDDAWTLAHELKFLVLHGVLHLAGWDDASEQLRADMLDRQRAILADFQSDPSRSR